MADGKKSFIVYTSWKIWLDGLNLEQKGEWLDWMMDYCNDLYPKYPNDQAVKIACMMAQDTLKRDLKKYEQRVERINTARNKNPNNNKELIKNNNKTDIELKSVRNQSEISSVNVNVNVNDNVLSKDNINNKVSKDTMSSKLNDSCKEIIDYLNFKTGKHFKSSTKSTQDFIKARLKDGYSIDDFKHVIDVKSSQWLNTESEQYLRPETLFRPSHFESYLNEQIKINIYDSGNYDVSSGLEELK